MTSSSRGLQTVRPLAASTPIVVCMTGRTVDEQAAAALHDVIVSTTS